ncbi:MAG: LrgB family protein [Acinetobacter populi]|jgi:putative effector of murein hydrolase|uniref:LrgB family protein n=1 Tax=Acinetobacter populi TaxID=1582270 RepID=UPI00235571DD|nr:LrgB family protein [Acinetobacter populi]MCH4246280.1 LrgB family protein [Acinetobacter populi]
MNIWAVACLVWTIVAYMIAKKIYQKHTKVWLSPAITVPTLTIILMFVFGISYQTYAQDTQWIVNLLGPATVAFAVPIYRHRDIIKKHILVLSVAIFVGMSVGVYSAYAMAQLFHFDSEVTSSLMARSISTPFAIVLAQDLHGSATLVSLFTVITGLVGMIFGDLILALTHVRSNIANGAAFGNGAHGFGTARAQQRDNEEGVIASLTMVIAGILMVLVGPSLIHLFLV